MAKSASKRREQQANRLISKLRRLGLTPSRIEELLADHRFTAWWANQLLLYPNPESSLIYGLFLPPERQIEKIKAWNREFDWGIPDASFAEAAASIPAWPHAPLVAVVLVPYLDDEDGRNGLIRTFQELWTCAVTECQKGSWSSVYKDTRCGGLRNLGDVEHRVGLRWETIDFGSHRTAEPRRVSHPACSPHAGVLAAAALHPRWIQRMDGWGIPYVLIPGYRVQPHHEKLDTPSLEFSRHSGIMLYARSADETVPRGWAIPSFYQKEAR